MFCGTRSWRGGGELLEGKEVFVVATFFDKASAGYTSTLKHKEKSILSGKVVSVYSNSVSVKFNIDNKQCSVPKKYLQTSIADEEKNFVLPDDVEPFESTDVESLASESDLDDSVLDPDYDYQGDLAKAGKSNSSTDYDLENQTSAFLTLSQGEEVILQQQGRAIFKATYDKVPDGGTVHGNVVGKDNGRFIVTKVFQGAASWPDFDAEEHIAGTILLWSLKDVKKFTDLVEADIAASCSTEYQTPTPLGERKRKRNPSKWASAIRKKARSTGSTYDYITKTKAVKTMPGRQLRAPCNPDCSQKCTSNINDEDRRLIFSNFWQLDGTEQKRLFLAKMVDRVKVKRQRKRANIKTKRRDRKNAFRYYFLKSTSRIPVCQKFFLNTLDISRKQVLTAMKKSTVVGGLEKDQRGQNSGHNMLKEDLIEQIVEHVCEFKTIESHYVRKDTEYQYLPSTLDISTMHRMYVKWCDDKKYKAVSYFTYRTILKEKFNLKFQMPKKDRCDQCEAWENTPKEERTESQKKAKQVHDEEKNLSRDFKTKAKKLSKENSHIQSSAFDFQKTLLAPAGQTSSFYYSLRLKVFHLTVSDLSFKNVNCYLWSEEQARKGANEVASSLLMYLHDLREKGISVVYLFADRCAGQNCNRFVFLLLSLALEWFSFSEITLSFLVTGHSQNENDTAHALVEREGQRLNTYSLDQWESVITFALTKNKDRNVVMRVLSHKDVLDFKSAAKMNIFSDIFKTKLKVDGSNIKWSKLMQVKFTQEKPNKMLFKYLYSENEYQEVAFMNKPRKSSRLSTSDIPAMSDFPGAYRFPPGITQDKYNSLKKLCDKNLIPTHHHSFFNNLQIQGREVESNTEEEFEEERQE